MGMAFLDHPPVVVPLVVMSRTTRSIWNLGSGVIFTVVTLAVGIYSTPVLLRWLGPEQFGTYRVLLDWSGYLLLFELGLGGSLMARFATSLGSGNPSMTRGLIAAGMKLYLR